MKQKTAIITKQTPEIEAYLRSIRKYQPLSQEEENEVFKMYHSNDPDAKKKAKSGKNVEISLPGPYSLHLKENNVTLALDSLADWSKNDDNKVKFFSGHGVYTTEVKVKKPQGNEVLHLGDVHNIAHVWVNGIDCGIVWTAPDYNNAVKFQTAEEFDVIYIAPRNGYVHISVGAGDRSIYVNNHKYRITGKYMSGVFMPVSKGDTIRIEDCFEATFIPCKE